MGGPPPLLCGGRCCGWSGAPVSSVPCRPPSELETRLMVVMWSDYGHMQRDASPPVLFPVAIALPVRRVRCLCCAVCVLGMSGCRCECDAGVVGLSGWGFVWGRVVSV